MNEAFTRHLPKVDYESTQVKLLDLCYILRVRHKIGVLLREVLFKKIDASACAYTTFLSEEQARVVEDIVKTRFSEHFTTKTAKMPDLDRPFIVFFIPTRKDGPSEKLSAEKKFERLLNEIETGGEK